MNYTDQLEYGDMVRRKTDGHLWVFVDSIDYGKDVHCMKFFDIQRGEIVSYTSVWGMSLPAVFTIV